MLAERDTGTAQLEEAISVSQAALDVFKASDASHFVKQAEANLSRAAALLAERRPQ